MRNDLDFENEENDGQKDEKQSGIIYRECLKRIEGQYQKDRPCDPGKDGPWVGQLEEQTIKSEEHQHIGDARISDETEDLITQVHLSAGNSSAGGPQGLFSGSSVSLSCRRYLSARY